MLFLGLSLLYWLQSAPSYDVEGFSKLTLDTFPVLIMVARVAFVIILLASIPIVKGVFITPVSLRCRCNFKRRTKLSSLQEEAAQFFISNPSHANRLDSLATPRG